ncbi:MAG: hypothetical protein ABI298_02505 [Acidimicrobiales bacterium]
MSHVTPGSFALYGAELDEVALEQRSLRGGHFVVKRVVAEHAVNE